MEHQLLCSVGEGTSTDIRACVESWLEWSDALVGAQGEEDWKTRGKGIWKRHWEWAAGRRSSYPPLRPTRASTVDEVLDSSGGKVLGQLVSISICPEPGLGCGWIRKGIATKAQTEATHHSKEQDGNAFPQNGHILGLSLPFLPVGPQPALWSEGPWWFDPPAQGPKQHCVRERDLLPSQEALQGLAPAFASPHLLP